MANKVHIINIGGKERTLKYTFDSFRALGSTAQKIIGKTVNWFEWIAMDHQELWLAMVREALTHETRDINSDRVSGWFTDLLQDGQDIRKAAIWPAQRALGESGVCGRRWTLDDDGKLIWLDEDQQGKGVSAGQ